MKHQIPILSYKPTKYGFSYIGHQICTVLSYNWQRLDSRKVEGGTSVVGEEELWMGWGGCGSWLWWVLNYLESRFLRNNSNYRYLTNIFYVLTFRFLLPIFCCPRPAHFTLPYMRFTWLEWRKNTYSTSGKKVI